MDISETERSRGAYQEERISPREAEWIKYRENRTMLTFTLLDGQTLEGAVRWFDSYAVRLVQADRTELTLHLHAIAYYRGRV